jgi:hypothetical protein
MDIEAHHAGRRLGRLSGVDTHAHLDAFAAGPGVSLKGLLHLHDRCHTSPRRRESGKESVAHGVEFRAAVRSQRRADQRVVAVSTCA